MAITTDQMVITKNFIASMSEDQLQSVIKDANHLLDCRVERRRKELWGNVVAAIRKYEQEIGEVEVHGELDCTISLDEDAIDMPGVLYVAY